MAHAPNTTKIGDTVKITAKIIGLHDNNNIMEVAYGDGYVSFLPRKLGKKLNRRGEYVDRVTKKYRVPAMA